MHTVGAERLYDGEHVVRRPRDDERQQYGAQRLGRLLVLSTLLATLTGPERAAALGRARRDANLHSEHHRLRRLGQPTPDQRAGRLRRRLGRDRTRRKLRPRLHRAAGRAPSPFAAAADRGGPTRGGVTKFRCR